MTAAIRGVLTAAVTGVLLASCATIPDTSSVHSVPEATESSQAPAHYQPRGPSTDAAPEDIVDGYMDAMLAYPVNRATAKKFLTDDAAEEWDPDASTVIYSGSAELSLRKQGDGSARVDGRVPQTGTLDRAGHLSLDETRRSAEFRLIQQDGQWRIESAPEGSFISQKYFNDNYGTFNLYYAGPSSKHLVADPVHVAVGDQTATELASALLRGPHTGLSDYVRSFVPEEAALSKSIPVDAHHVAEVALTADLSELSQSRRQDVAAQLVWTLTQVRSINTVKIRDENGAVSVGGHRMLRRRTWQSYDPDPNPVRSYGVRDDTLHELSVSASEPVTGGSIPHDASSAAVRDDTVAVIGDGRLRVGSLGDDDSDEVRDPGLVAPEVDDTSDVVVGINDDAEDGNAGRIAVYADGDLRTIATEDDVESYRSRQRPVTQFALSPDGARYVIVTGRGDDGVAAVGMVRRDDDGTIESLARPAEMSAVSSVDAVEWTSDTALVIASGDDGGRIHHVSIDGEAVPDSEFDVRAPADSVRCLSVATQKPETLYLLDDSDRLWSLREGATWHRFDDTFTTVTSAC